MADDERNLIDDRLLREIIEWATRSPNVELDNRIKEIHMEMRGYCPTWAKINDIRSVYRMRLREKEKKQK